MFRSYLKIALRNIVRQKGYSLINITGLTIGLVISLVIAFYVIDDLTFDRFHPESENIYRSLTLENTNSGTMTYSITAGPIMPAAKENIPEVVAATRAFAIGTPFVAAGSVPFAEMNADNAISLRGFMTEPEFFNVFGFKIIRGDRETALVDPNGVLLTPDAAVALFDEEDPIGKRLTLPGVQEPFVIGIVEAPPTNSHIQYQFIRPLRVENNPLWWDSWENFMLQGYFRLSPGADQATVEEKLVNLARANGMPEINTPKLQPLLDVHLGSAHHRYDGSNRGKNDKTVVYALAVIGLLIIAVAVINFINLSSARASRRAREVGMRKVVGSNKLQLIMQFLGESIIITVIAMIFSLFILQFTLPQINNLLGKQLEISFFDNPLLLLGMLGFAIFVGIMSGLYPAFILSAFKPVTVLKGEFNKSGVGATIRKVLVLCQFAITISLIVAVLMIREQIIYLKSMDLGYTRDQVVTIFTPNNNNADQLFNDRASTLPGVAAIGRSSGVLGGDFIRYEVIPEGSTREDGQMFQQLAIDDNFFSSLEIEFAEGRPFSLDFPSDSSEAIIVNQTAARKAGWDNPIGKRLEMVEIDGSITAKYVVGVVKDFHFASARQKIEPLFFQYNPGNTFLSITRLSGGQIPETLEALGDVYTAAYPNQTFNYQFLDDLFDQQFDNDRAFAVNIAYFSGIAIFIACLGLIGLVAFTVSQRKGEIAIRKVLGSGESRLFFLLAKDFLKWVLIANLIAWPLSYLGISLWLDGFAYRVSLRVMPFIYAGLAAVVIALLTISFQTIRAARANPADSLRTQ